MSVKVQEVVKPILAQLLCSLIAVVPLPTGHEMMTYLLLHNGSDTRYCGGSADSACSSLPHIITLYFAQPQRKGLQILTEKSLVIDNKIMVSFYFSETLCQIQSSNNQIKTHINCLLVSEKMYSIQEL